MQNKKAHLSKKSYNQYLEKTCIRSKSPVK